MPFLLADNLRVDQTQKTVSYVVLGLSPNHRNSKRQTVSFSLCPVTKHFLTIMTYHMRSPFLVLIAKGNFKIGFIGMPHKRSYIALLTSKCVAATYAAECVRIIYTLMSTSRSHAKI